MIIIKKITHNKKIKNLKKIPTFFHFPLITTITKQASKQAKLFSTTYITNFFTLIFRFYNLFITPH
jgi:hypothetical protein